MTAAAPNIPPIDVENALKIIGRVDRRYSDQLYNTLSQAIDKRDAQAVDRIKSQIFSEARLIEREQQQPRQPERIERAPSRKRGLESSHVIRAETIESTRPRFERWLAYIILVASWIGTIFAANGGWNAVWVDYNSVSEGVRVVIHIPIVKIGFSFNPIATLVGIALQALLTYVQTAYKDWRDWRYILSLLVDMAMSTIGYYDVAMPALLGLATSLFIPVVYVWYVAFGVFVGINFGGAWVPERILVKRK